MTTVAATAAEGLYERVRMLSRDLAAGRFGPYWYLLDMTGDRAAQLGPAFETRWEAVEEAEKRMRRGDYR